MSDTLTVTLLVVPTKVMSPNELKTQTLVAAGLFVVLALLVARLMYETSFVMKPSMDRVRLERASVPLRWYPLSS